MGSIGKILRRTRNYIDDPGQRQWSDLDSANSAGLITLINDEIRFLESCIRELRQDYFVSSTFISTVQGQNNYAVPSNFVDMLLAERVKNSSNQSIPPVTLEVMQSIQQKNSIADQTEVAAIMVFGNEFILAPTPTFPAVSNYIKIWYSRRNALPESGEVLSPLPDECDDLIALGAARRALLQTQEPVEDIVAMYDKVYEKVMRDLLARNVQEPKRSNVYNSHKLWQPPQGT